MATPLYYKTRNSEFVYGKCLKPPFSHKNLWFVHVPAGINGQNPSVTYIVPEEYANPSLIDNYYKDAEKWENIAKYSITGSDWNPVEECLWRDMPYQTHILPNGTPVRYGLSRPQPKNPDRELWYVTIGASENEKIDWRENKYESFVVDKICTSEKFLDLMGTDLEKWSQIAWEHPAGIEPWEALIEDDYAPDPFCFFTKDDMQRGYVEKSAGKFLKGLFN